MKYKIQHKEGGWTGEIEFDELVSMGEGSHTQSGNIHFFLTQDRYDEEGNYHEDPRIESLKELEFIQDPVERVKEE